MESGPDRSRSQILTDRTHDRGFYVAVGLSAAVHVVALVALFVAGDLDLRPEQPTTYAAGLAGGLPAGLESQLPDLGGNAPRVDPAPPPPRPKPEPKAPERKPPPDALAAVDPDPSDEPPDVILPGAATATPRATASPTPRPTASPTPKPTQSPEPTATASPAPSPSVTPAATASPKPTASPSPKPKPTASPGPKPKPTSKPKPAPTKKAKSTPAPNPEAEAKPEKKPAAPQAKASEAKKDDEAPSTASDAAGAETAPPAPGAESQADRDARIAAAMERVRARVGSGGGSPATGNAMGGAGRSRGGVPGGVPGGGGTGGFGTGTGGGGTLRGADFLIYYNEMITRIRDAWVWVGGSADLEVEVGFGVTPSGDIVGMRIVRPSGDRSYDESVLRALRTVRNLGPPPERHRQTFSEVQLTFRPADLERSP